MSKILLIASAVFLLMTAGLSFANKGKMAAKTEDIKRITSEKAAAQTDASKTRATLKETDKKLGEETARATQLQTDLTAREGDLAKAKDEAKLAADNLTQKDADIDRLNKALVAKAAGGGTPQPADGDLGAQVAKLTVERDELKAVKDALDNKVKGMETQVTNLQRERAQHIAGTTKPGLAGRILAVDRNWNFVVVSLGDRNGVNSNTQMVVRRGESMVGRVRITSVEPSQSIADIVPNSVPPGVSVEAGDTVIFQ